MQLSETRKAKGVSQMRLAIKTGISRNKISLIECGYIKASSEDLKKLKGALRNVKNTKSRSK